MSADNQQERREDEISSRCRFRLSDALPIYGCVNFSTRTTFRIGESPTIRNHVSRALKNLALALYGGCVLGETIRVAEGNTTLTYQILESLIN